MRRINVAMAILSVAGGALTAGAAVDVPFSDSFDPTTNSNWIATATVTNVAAHTETGPNSMYVTESALLPVDTLANNVWFSFYAKFTPFVEGDDHPDISTNAAAFYMSTTNSGSIWAHDFDDYVKVVDGIDTNGWHGFAIQLDFNNKTWNIYHKGPLADHSSTLTLLKADTPLRMRDGFSGNFITAIEITGETLVDHLSLTRAIQPAPVGDPPPATAATESVDEDIVPQAGDQYSGPSLRYFGTSVQLQNSAFGDALAAALGDGAVVWFWNGAAFVSRTVTGSGWSDDFTITPTTGMILPGAPANPARFTANYDSLISHTAGDPTPVVNGWNFLALPFTAGNRTPGQLNLPNLQANDFLFVRVGGRWVMIRYNGTAWTSNPTIPAGSGFWYQRRGGNTDWGSNGL